MQKLIIRIAPDVSIELSGDTPREVIKEAAFWASVPTQCAICQASVYLFHKTTKTADEYWGLRCHGNAEHETNFGVLKIGNGLYYKGKDSWKMKFGSHNEQDDEYSANQEPRGEHERLDREIDKAWKAEPRKVTFANAIETRFHKKPEDLMIAEKRQVLEGLKAPQPA